MSTEAVRFERCEPHVVSDFHDMFAVTVYGHLVLPPDLRMMVESAEAADALETLLRQPRCGDILQWAIGQTTLVCDLTHGHAGRWHGCTLASTDQGWASRTEWNYDDADEPPIIHVSATDTDIAGVAALRAEVETVRAALVQAMGGPDMAPQAHDLRGLAQAVGKRMKDLEAALDRYQGFRP